MGVSIFGATWAIFREGAGRQRHCGSCKSQHQLGNSGLGKGVGFFFFYMFISPCFFLSLYHGDGGGSSTLLAAFLFSTKFISHDLGLHIGIGRYVGG